jgi:hypothetical protein
MRVKTPPLSTTAAYDLTTEKPTEQEKAQKATAKALKLPPGLQFRLGLTREIDTSTAAAGDLVKAELTSSIKEKHNGVRVPKGIQVAGRIIRIERFYGSATESLMLVIKLETVVINGMPEHFDARLESVTKKPIRSIESSVVRESLGWFEQTDDSEDPSFGVLKFPDVTKDYIIDRGLELVGITAAPK